MWVTGGGLAIGFSLWGNGLGLDRAGRYLYPFFPPAQQRGEGRDDQAERLRRAAILIAPLPTPGPLPVKATRRSLPHNREASSGPSPDREPPGRVRDGSAAGGACRGKRGAITTPKRPTFMPGGPKKSPTATPSLRSWRTQDQLAATRCIQAQGSGRAATTRSPPASARRPRCVRPAHPTPG